MENTALPKKKIHISALLLSALATLLCLILIWGMLSRWGSVRIRREFALTADGRQYSYLSYVPKDASDSKQYPCVIVFHGGADNAQNFDGWQLELVRRGYAVFSLDENGTTYTDTGIDNNSLAVEFTNMIQKLPFINADKVVTCGHSMGGMYTIVTNTECNIAGGIVAHANKNKEFGGNLAFVFGHADIYNRWSAEDAQRFYKDAFYTDGTAPAEDTDIGSVAAHNYRRIHYQTGNGSHPSARWNSDTIAYVCEYAEYFASSGTTLTPQNQQYQVLFAISLLGIVSFFALIVCFMLALLRHPFFASVKRPLPEYMGVTGKEWAFSAALTMLPTIPFYLLCGYITAKFTSLSKGTVFLPVGTLNKFILFIVVQGLWDTLTFFLLFYKKKKLAMHEYGLCWSSNKHENMVNIGKSFLLAAATAAFGLTFLDLLDSKFGLGYTAWWMSIRSITFDRVIHASGYLVLFFFVYLGAQFGSNIVRRFKPTGHEIQDMLRDIAVNCIVGGGMICLLFFFQYWTQNHQIFITLINNTITTHQFYGYMLTVMCSQAVNTVLYRKTGSIWPGLLLLTIMFGYIIPGGFPISITL